MNVGGYAPRAREESVRPRRLSGASRRPLDFTIREHAEERRASHDRLDRIVVQRLSLSC